MSPLSYTEHATERQVRNHALVADQKRYKPVSAGTIRIPKETTCVARKG